MKPVSLLLSIVLFAGMLPNANAEPIAKKYQRSIVGIHNAYRGPLKVRKLEWSEDLAKSAQVWAGMLENSGCPNVHSPAEIRNNSWENLYVGWSASPGYRISIKNGVYAWAKEKPFYRYASNSCAADQVCGHYTQMVWQDTRHIGCALAHCDAPGKSTEILVCHYDPPGNYEGGLPYYAQ